MHNDRQSPFGKKTLATESLMRSETKNSQVLLLASKKKHLENLSQSPSVNSRYQEKTSLNDSHPAGSASVRRKFTEYLKEKDDTIKKKKNIITELNIIYSDYENCLDWHDNFMAFVNEKKFICIEDHIPNALNSDGEVLLCETHFWIMFIKFNIDKINQKMNLQRIVNLFNECLRYEQTDYDLIYTFFNDVVSKFPKNLILTHISLNDNYKNKCPISPDQIDVTHYKFLLDHPEYMLEGQLNHTFDSKKPFNPESVKKSGGMYTIMDSVAKKSVDYNKYASAKKLDFGHEFSEKNIETVLSSSNIENIIKNPFFKEQNFKQKGKEIKLTKKKIILENPKMYSERDIAILITSFYEKSPFLKYYETLSNESNGSAKNFKENFFKQFKFNFPSHKNKLDDNLNAKGIKLKYLIEEEHDIQTEKNSIDSKYKNNHSIHSRPVIDSKQKSIKEYLIEKTGNSERKLKIPDNYESNNSNNKNIKLNEEEFGNSNFTFTRELFPNDLSNIDVSYNKSTVTPINTPIKDSNLSFSNINNVKTKNLFTSSNLKENNHLRNFSNNIEETEINYKANLKKNNNNPEDNQESLNQTELIIKGKYKYINSKNNNEKDVKNEINLSSLSGKRTFESNILISSKENNINICKYFEQETQTERESSSLDNRIEISYPPLRMRNFNNHNLKPSGQNDFNLLYYKKIYFDENTQTEIKEFKDSFTEIYTFSKDQTTSTSDLMKTNCRTTDTFDLVNRVDQITDTDKLAKRNDQTTNTDDLNRFIDIASNTEIIPNDRNYLEFPLPESIDNLDKNELVLNVNMSDISNQPSTSQTKSNKRKNTRKSVKYEIDEDYIHENEDEDGIHININKDYKTKLRSYSKLSESQPIEKIEKRSLVKRINYDDDSENLIKKDRKLTTSQRRKKK